MSLELLFLGTGTSAGIPMIGCNCAVCRSPDPRDQRSRPSVVVSYHDPALVSAAPSPAATPHPHLDSAAFVPPGSRPRPATRHLLIDTSPEMRTQVIRSRIEHLDGVLYTHAHADHIFGLDDLRRFNAVMHGPIDLYAEQATLDILRGTFWYIFEPHRNVNQSWVAQLTVHTVAPGEGFDLFGARWTPLRLMHGRLPILGFRVDHAGKSLAYCTDVSTVPPETMPQLQGLDVLVLDALRYTPHPTHMTVEQSLATIERIKPRRAYLTHIAHDIQHAELDPRLPEHVSLAFDGLVVSC